VLHTIPAAAHYDQVLRWQSALRMFGGVPHWHAGWQCLVISSATAATPDGMTGVRDVRVQAGDEHALPMSPGALLIHMASPGTALHHAA